MKAVVTKEWEGKDAFIVGGGASLKAFDFYWLQNRNAIGVNDAFRLGKLCSRAIFGDDKFWKTAKWDLEEYSKQGGVVYSVCPMTARLTVPWLLQLTRGAGGLSDNPNFIGWNHNTGGAALNLALLMGARRIFLLGFDMTAVASGATHWHNHRPGPTPKSSFDRFLGGFSLIHLQMCKFPGQEVLNVTDGSSKLQGFRRVTEAQMEEMV